MNPWETLGVSAEIGVADLRRRYAALIKEFRPETHAQDFARIREAYEVVLPFARRREQEAFEEVVTATGSDDIPLQPPEEPFAEQPQEMADAAPLPMDNEIAISDAAITAVLAAEITDVPPQADDEPGLAGHFHRFHELAEAAAGTRDEALLPELHALLQARTRATLDDSQALEFALMRWFIEAEMPPLTLLFETGRAFDWHRHPGRLSTWLSAGALRQMEVRLQMSRDLVYARHFSGNAWLRRLHSPRHDVTLIASRTATLDALRWAERWQHASDDADAPHLASALDAHTLTRLRGRELLTTDVLTGVVVACAAPDLADAALYAVIATAVTFALRLLALRVRPAPSQYRLPPPIARFLVNQPGIAFLGIAMVAGLGIALLLPGDAGVVSLVAGMLLVSPVLMLVLRLLWNGLSWLERCVAELFAWRGAVDRLELAGFMRSPVPAAETTAPFGARLSLLARWKAIPAALPFEKVELATRARPMRPILFKRLAALRRKPSLGRMLWFGAWIVFVILRVVHAVYSK